MAVFVSLLALAVLAALSLVGKAIKRKMADSAEAKRESLENGGKKLERMLGENGVDAEGFWEKAFALERKDRCGAKQRWIFFLFLLIGLAMAALSVVILVAMMERDLKAALLLSGFLAIGAPSVIISSFDKITKKWNGRTGKVAVDGDALETLVCSAAMPGSEFIPDEGLPLKTLMESGMFIKPDVCRSKGYGYYLSGGVACEWGDFELLEYTQTTDPKKAFTFPTNRKNRGLLEAYAKGRFFHFGFSKDLGGWVCVKEREGVDCDGKRGDETEDIDFNDEFLVTASDQTKAFYVLTPQMMLAIKALERKFYGAVELKWIGSDLYVAILDFGESFSQVGLSSDEEVKALAERYAAPEIFMEELGLHSDKFEG